MWMNTKNAYGFSPKVGAKRQGGHSNSVADDFDPVAWVSILLQKVACGERESGELECGFNVHWFTGSLVHWFTGRVIQEES